MKLLTAIVLAVLTGMQNKPSEGTKMPAALNFTMKSIDGKPIDLSKYQGRVVLMVNVAVVVETVFAWPGVGRLLYEGIAFRDFPVVQATVLVGGSMIVVVNLVVDLLYAVIDPRIRYER